jgi:hypothetical protein
MRKVANLKKHAPFPIPDVGTEFTISGIPFQVTDVSLNKTTNKEYVAQIDIDSQEFRMVILLTSSKPFAMESDNV